MSSIAYDRGESVRFMAPGEWSPELAMAYEQGTALVETDANNLPTAAYRRCFCDLCQEMRSEAAQEGKDQ